MDRAHKQKSLRFGRCELQPHERRLYVDGVEVQLPPRALDLLIVLVRHAGVLMLKETLFAQAWPGLIVEESNLHVQVSTLRKALGHDVIKTVPGHGYRFEASPPLAPLVAAAATTRHNLPRALTSFIGREADLAEYARVLAQSRLVTLIGIGGSGKTRLAIELGELVLSQYADGVWFVDLAPVLDSSRTALSVAAALGIGEAIAQSVSATLCERLKSRQTLLILDNCEHLLDSCAALIQTLLETAPGLRIVATSREALSLPGEVVLSVRPLSIPDLEEAPEVDPVLASDAVALFAARAMQVAPKFTLDHATVTTIVDICRRLDGIPLAIELAAARAKALSVEQIRARLDDRFQLLVSAGRALPRHHRLRTVIEWSYEHLNPEQQRLLRHLSVFAGGWTLEAAVAVVGSTGQDPDPLDALTSLIDKSLVTVEHAWHEEPRYRMLETVREFMEARLHENEERTSARSQHLAYYLALATAVPADMNAAQKTKHVRRFDAERENILLAHEWCDHVAGGAEQGIRLANAMHWYWFSRLTTDFRSNSLGHHPVAIGHRMTLHALARPGLARTEGASQAHMNAGIYCDALGLRADAQWHFDESLAIARACNSRRLVALALNYQSGPLSDQGAFADAVSCLEEARKIHEAERDVRRMAFVVARLGHMRLLQGALDLAEGDSRAAVASAATSRDARTQVFGILNLVGIALRRGATATAAKHLLEALTTPAEGRSPADTPPPPGAMELLPCVAASANDGPACARFRGAIDANWQRIGLQRAPAEELFFESFIAPARSRLATTAFDESYGAGRALSLKNAAHEGRAWLARFLAMGES